jgi:hypothetical protein
VELATSPPPPPRTPSISPIIFSTGPPGTNWVIAKVTTITPNRVGTISRILLRIYAIIIFHHQDCLEQILLSTIREILQIDSIKE